MAIRIDFEAHARAAHLGQRGSDARLRVVIGSREHLNEGAEHPLPLRLRQDVGRTTDLLTPGESLDLLRRQRAQVACSQLVVLPLKVLLARAGAPDAGVALLLPRIRLPQAVERRRQREGLPMLLAAD